MSWLWRTTEGQTAASAEEWMNNYLVGLHNLPRYTCSGADEVADQLEQGTRAVDLTQSNIMSLYHKDACCCPLFPTS